MKAKMIVLEFLIAASVFLAIGCGGDSGNDEGDETKLQVSVASVKVLVNEFFRNGNLSSSDEWIELVLIEDFTAEQLEGFYVGDSTLDADAKYSGYRFTGMETISSTFPKGSIIVIGGDTSFEYEDTDYDPTNGDWDLILKASGDYLAGNGYTGDIASSDVIYTDSNGDFDDSSLSAYGFAVKWGSGAGAFGDKAHVVIPATANATGGALVSDLTGSLSSSAWSVNLTAALSPGMPNGGANTVYLGSLRQ